MLPGERRIWTELLNVEEYKAHMARIGQAEANANLTRRMFQESPLRFNSTLLIPGCGPGQLFNYIAPSDLGEHLIFTLTDINQDYLQAAREALERHPETRYRTTVDDIEDTRLHANLYSAVLITLVLQHVEWKQALASMSGLRPLRFYIITQEQLEGTPAVTTSRPDLADCWRQAAEIADGELVGRDDLVGCMEQHGYHVLQKYEVPVPDNKLMIGHVFEDTDLLLEQL